MKKGILIFLLFVPYGFSQNVILTWDRDDDAVQYQAFWGLDSYSYSDSIFGYNATTIKIPISRFEQKRIYYFAVKAIDAAGNKSQFSEEVSSFIITGIKDNGINFKESDCDEVKTYNILTQRVKSDRSQLSSGFYVRRCFVGGDVVWTKSEVLVK